MFRGFVLPFDLSRATAMLGVDEGWTLRFDLSAPFLHQLRLPNGRNMLALPASMFLRIGSGEDVEDGHMIGTVHRLEPKDDANWKDEAHFSVECVIPEERMTQLVTAVVNGHAPDAVTVTVLSGLKYGWGPEEKEWISEKESVPVNDLLFRWSSKEPASDDLDAPIREVTPPVNKEHIALVERLDRLHKSSEDLGKALALIGAVVVIVALKYLLG